MLTNSVEDPLVQVFADRRMHYRSSAAGRNDLNSTGSGSKIFQTRFMALDSHDCHGKSFNSPWRIILTRKGKKTKMRHQTTMTLKWPVNRLKGGCGFG